MAPTPRQWERLGELLIARRIHLDVHYSNRSRFAREKGFNDERLISDVELHRRTNFGPETFAKFERAYELPTGSIRRFLNEEITDADALVHADTVHARASVPAVEPHDADDLTIVLRASAADLPPYLHVERLPRWAQVIWLNSELTVDVRRMLVSMVEHVLTKPGTNSGTAHGERRDTG